MLPKQYVDITSSDRLFRIQQKDEYSYSVVPQGCIFASILYLLYTSNISTLKDTAVVTIADYTKLLVADRDQENCIRIL